MILLNWRKNVECLKGENMYVVFLSMHAHQEDMFGAAGVWEGREHGVRVGEGTVLFITGRCKHPAPFPLGWGVPLGC